MADPRLMREVERRDVPAMSLDGLARFLTKLSGGTPAEFCPVEF
jgi:hypothetical protein